MPHAQWTWPLGAETGLLIGSNSEVIRGYLQGRRQAHQAPLNPFHNVIASVSTQFIIRGRILDRLQRFNMCGDG